MRIDRLDHIVLTVEDIEATCAFYSKVLGIKVVVFGDNRTALTFGKQKINVITSYSIHYTKLYDMRRRRVFRRFYWCFM